MKIDARHLTIILAMCFAFAGRTEEVHEFPYKDAKVGDWVEYKTKISIPPRPNDSSIHRIPDTSQKYTVTEKTDTTITIKMTLKVAGHEFDTFQKVSLDSKFDPGVYRQVTHGGKPSMQYKEVGTSEETVTVGKKPLAAAVFTYDVNQIEDENHSNQHTETPTKAKIWRSNEVNLGGLIKMEFEYDDHKTLTLQLIDMGNGN